MRRVQFAEPWTETKERMKKEKKQTYGEPCNEEAPLHECVTKSAWSKSTVSRRFPFSRKRAAHERAFIHRARRDWTRDSFNRLDRRICRKVADARVIRNSPSPRVAIPLLFAVLERCVARGDCVGALKRPLLALREYRRCARILKRS